MGGTIPRFPIECEEKKMGEGGLFRGGDYCEVYGTLFLVVIISTCHFLIPYLIFEFYLKHFTFVIVAFPIFNIKYTNFDHLIRQWQREIRVAFSRSHCRKKKYGAFDATMTMRNTVYVYILYAFYKKYIIYQKIRFILELNLFRSVKLFLYIIFNSFFQFLPCYILLFLRFTSPLPWKKIYKDDEWTCIKLYVTNTSPT